MRMIAALAALLVTGIIMFGVPAAVLWIINPVSLLQCAGRFHSFVTIVPALIPLFIVPTLVIAMRRKPEIKEPR
jgi:hypothetical protein